MVNDYIGDSKFKSFVRCVAALPFLPLTELESTVKELKNWKLASKEQELFRDQFMEYIESYWMNGSFPPKVWNCWRKSRNTNNTYNKNK